MAGKLKHAQRSHRSHKLSIPVFKQYGKKAKPCTIYKTGNIMRSKLSLFERIKKWLINVFSRKSIN